MTWRWPWQKPKHDPEGSVRIMDDPGAPLVCGHCGAVWDDRHERGECGVAQATQRILSGPRRPR